MALPQMTCLICVNLPEEALKPPAAPDAAQRESSDYFINRNPLCSLLIKPA